MRKFAARVDANQSAIVRTLERMGAGVKDCSRIGGGHPDLEVWWRGQVLYAEVKDGAKSASRRELTPEQAIWHAEAARYGVKVHVLTCEADALAMLGARRAA
jgi:hypothetical protein